jgi:hypothetical protein
LQVEKIKPQSTMNCKNWSGPMRPAIFSFTAFFVLGGSSCRPEPTPFLPSELEYPAIAGELVVADLNGDGFPEIAASSGTTAFVFFGDASKTFSRAEAPLAPITLRATLSAADIDGDGSLELLATGTVVQDQSHFSQVFKAQNNELSPPINQLLEGGIFASPYHAVGDFDGDGDGDLAVIQDTQVFIYPGDGTTFGGTPSIVDAGRPILSRSLAAGDVDGDGKDDLAGCGPQGTVLLFGAVGPTVESPTFLSDDDQIKARIADLNNDGRADVASVGRNVTGLASFSISSTRVVTALTPFTVGAVENLLGYVDFVPADFNKDGLIDVAAIRIEQDGAGNKLVVGLSLQSGASFSAIPNLPTAVNSQNAEIEAGDLDQDGFVDLVISDNDRARIVASPGLVPGR